MLLIAFCPFGLIYRVFYVVMVEDPSSETPSLAYLRPLTFLLDVLLTF